MDETEIEEEVEGVEEKVTDEDADNMKAFFHKGIDVAEMMCRSNGLPLEATFVGLALTSLFTALADETDELHEAILGGMALAMKERGYTPEGMVDPDQLIAAMTAAIERRDNERQGR